MYHLLSCLLVLFLQTFGGVGVLTRKDEFNQNTITLAMADAIRERPNRLKMEASRVIILSSSFSLHVGLNPSSTLQRKGRASLTATDMTESYSGVFNSLL
jgi:hypothetical protein